MRAKSLLKKGALAALGVVCGMGAVIGYRAVVAEFRANAGAAPSAQAAAAPVGAPATLVIPAIGVSAPVTAVGIAKDGSLGVPSDAIHVAWYKYGPKPGEPGAAVIDGHLDTIHAPEAVFYNLDKLAPGDELDVVTAAGQKLVFKVTGTETLPYDATTSAIFTTTSTVPELNLITCAGDWVKAIKLYNERFVVFSELVSSSAASSSSSS